MIEPSKLLQNFGMIGIFSQDPLISILGACVLLILRLDIAKKISRYGLLLFRCQSVLSYKERRLIHSALNTIPLSAAHGHVRSGTRCQLPSTDEEVCARCIGNTMDRAIEGGQTPVKNLKSNARLLTQNVVHWMNNFNLVFTSKLCAYFCWPL